MTPNKNHPFLSQSDRERWVIEKSSSWDHCLSNVINWIKRANIRLIPSYEVWLSQVETSEITADKKESLTFTELNWMDWFFHVKRKQRRVEWLIQDCLNRKFYIPQNPQTISYAELNGRGFDIEENGTDKDITDASIERFGQVIAWHTYNGKPLTCW